MFYIPLYKFPLISACYLCVRQPYQEIAPFYTCCKYIVSMHSYQIKSPCSTFVIVCCTFVCHEPANNIFISRFLIIIVKWLENSAWKWTHVHSTIVSLGASLLSIKANPHDTQHQHQQVNWSAMVIAEDFPSFLNLRTTTNSLCNKC